MKTKPRIKISLDLQTLIQDKLEQGVSENVFAAAPDLLAALKDCQVQLAEYVEWHQKRGGCSVEIESAEAEARRALAAAQGKE